MLLDLGSFEKCTGVITKGIGAKAIVSINIGLVGNFQKCDLNVLLYNYSLYNSSRSTFW